MLQGGEVTGTAVIEGVRALLHDPAYQRGAQQLRSDIFALPTPNELVGQLEELAIKHRQERS
jgi:hypothetical protein